MSAKYALMDEQKANFPVVMMARLLQISRQGYYRWAKSKHLPAKTKLFTVFTALILTTELQRRIKTAGLNNQYTLTELLEQYRSAGHRPHILNITKTQTETKT